MEHSCMSILHKFSLHTKYTFWNELSDRNVTFSDLILQNRPCVLNATVFFRFCGEVRFIRLFPVSSVCSSHGFSPPRYSTHTSIPLILYCNHSTNPPSRVDAGSRSENTEQLRERERESEREEKEKWRGEKLHGNRVKVEYLLEWAIWRQTVCTWARVPE